MTHWPVRDRFLNLKTRWFALIGEHLDTEQGEVLEYWRIERADSVIVLPLLAEHLLVLKPSYRPGIGKATLDFPGGRILPDQSPGIAAVSILQRELQIEPTAVSHLMPLNLEGWPINSSFSNQRLYGFVAELQPNTAPPARHLRFTTDQRGIQALEQELECLQCRAVLREWQAQSWVDR